VRAVIDPHAWTRPAVFTWLQQAGNVPEAEMWRTFNCGIGMCVVLAPAQVKAAQALLAAHDVPSYVIGEIQAAAAGEKPQVVFTGG